MSAKHHFHRPRGLVSAGYGPAALA
jgi:hypothetical protein